MEEAIKQLMRETEYKIIDVLVRAYNSGRINKEEFPKYEMGEIKKLLFMRSELDSKLYDLFEGCQDGDMEEI